MCVSGSGGAVCYSLMLHCCCGAEGLVILSGFHHCGLAECIMDLLYFFIFWGAATILQLQHYLCTSGKDSTSGSSQALGGFLGFFPLLIFRIQNRSTLISNSFWSFTLFYSKSSSVSSCRQLLSLVFWWVCQQRVAQGL